MNDEMDALILSIATERWQKVARLLDVAEATVGESEEAYFALLHRVQALAAEGRLESQGNLARPTYSEVRLPRSSPE